MRRLTIALLALVWSLAPSADELQSRLALADIDRGRLVFGPCRTCHYPDAFMGHNNGPNLSGIFGKVAGKQPGFEYYSERFKEAEFVWTPQLMFAWLENPMAMFPDSVMMSRGVPDPQDRADLIAYLKQATLRD
jgi:cytochrome c